MVIAAVLFIAGCTGTVQQPDGIDGQPIPQAGNQVTGNVVAVVNDEEITQDEVAAVQTDLSQQDQQITEQEALGQVINTGMLEQQASQLDYTVSAEEGEEFIVEQLSQQGVTLDQYRQQLASQAISYETQLEIITSQLEIQNYLDDVLDNRSFNVTEEEARQFYELYANQSAQEVEPYEEVEEQIVSTLKDRLRQEAIASHIEELRQDASIEYK